jgi:sulfotransferase family protein
MASSRNNFRFFGALARAGRVLAGRQMAGRGLTVFPDDVFLVSYPRSGNTWTRFLVGNLVNQRAPVTFSNLESLIPEIYFNPDRVLRQLPRPRLLKSHESFQPHYPAVIYIVRDPRDVAVSFFHHHVKARNIPDDYPMASFIPRFIAGEFDPKFGSWRDNVLSWTSVRARDPRFLFLRYEDMKRDTESALASITSFLARHSFRQIDASSVALRQAIELSSPERMREMEKKEAANWVLTKDTRSDKPFVRSAVAGGWKYLLARESVAAIEQAWGDLMQSLGYELTSASTREVVSRQEHSS